MGEGERVEGGAEAGFFQGGGEVLRDLDLARGGVQLKRDLDLCAVLHAAGFPVDLGQWQQELAAHDRDVGAVGVAVEGDGDFRALALPEAFHHRRRDLDAHGVHIFGLAERDLEFGHVRLPPVWREHIARFVVGERDPQG